MGIGSVFDKIGDAFGSVFDKLTDILPLVSSFIKVRMNKGDAESVRIVCVEIEQLGHGLVEVGRLGQGAVHPDGDGGDDITLDEAKQLYDRLTAVGDEAGDVVRKVRALIDQV